MAPLQQHFFCKHAPIPSKSCRRSVLVFYVKRQGVKSTIGHLWQWFLYMDVKLACCQHMPSIQGTATASWAAFAAMRIALEHGGRGVCIDQTSGYQNVSITLFQLQETWQPHAHDALNAETSWTFPRTIFFVSVRLLFVGAASHPLSLVTACLSNHLSQTSSSGIPCDVQCRPSSYTPVCGYTLPYCNCKRKWSKLGSTLYNHGTMLSPCVSL